MYDERCGNRDMTHTHTRTHTHKNVYYVLRFRERVSVLLNTYIACLVFLSSGTALRWPGPSHS